MLFGMLVSTAQRCWLLYQDSTSMMTAASAVLTDTQQYNIRKALQVNEVRKVHLLELVDGSFNTAAATTAAAAAHVQCSSSTAYGTQLITLL
jgi:hypothetical protein